MARVRTLSAGERAVLQAPLPNKRSPDNEAGVAVVENAPRPRNPPTSQAVAIPVLEEA